MTTAPFLALHAIHTVPASLLNRDENGAAKRITVDGTPRVRVSSQSWKRALRTHHRDALLDSGGAGLRTNRLAALVAAELTDRDVPEEKAALVAASALSGLNLSANPKTGNTNVMVFTSTDAPKSIADTLAANIDDIDGDTVPDTVLDAVRKAFDVGSCIDLALYGRMLAEIPQGGRIDGALQVAHAFSTHPGSIEVDFFTAVDDAATDGAPASGMLDTVDLTAPTLYRYAALDRRQLTKNLAAADDTAHSAATAEALVVDDFIKATPSAKQRSSGATTLPAIVVAVTGEAAHSAADAFAPAITGRNITVDSAARMVAHLRRITDLVGGSIYALPINDAVCDALNLDGVTVADSVAGLTESLQ